MTQREAQFFVQRIQFAFASLPENLERDLKGIHLAEDVGDALKVNIVEMVTLTPDIHRSLDLGGFRGEIAQRRAKQ